MEVGGWQECTKGLGFRGVAVQKIEWYQAQLTAV